MRCPSHKALTSTFKLSAKQADLIRKICVASAPGGKLRAVIEANCPATRVYADSCAGDPFASRMWRRTMALHAINDIVGGHGVEGLGEGSYSEGYAPPYEYINFGDPYVTTLIYKRVTDNLYIGNWGAIAERMPSSDGHGRY